MDTLTSFQEAIKAYLDQRASEDPLFAMNYAKPAKSLAECERYIMGEVSKMNTANARCLALSDDEVFSMAVHYYDEDDIKVEEITRTPEVSRSDALTEAAKQVELTEEEREKAREMAVQREADRLSKERAERARRAAEIRKAAEPQEELSLNLFGDES